MAPAEKTKLCLYLTRHLICKYEAPFVTNVSGRVFRSRTSMYTQKQALKMEMLKVRVKLKKKMKSKKE